MMVALGVPPHRPVEVSGQGGPLVRYAHAFEVYPRQLEALHEEVPALSPQVRYPGVLRVAVQVELGCAEVCACTQIGLRRADVVPPRQGFIPHLLDALGGGGPFPAPALEVPLHDPLSGLHAFPYIRAPVHRTAHGPHELEGERGVLEDITIGVDHDDPLLGRLECERGEDECCGDKHRHDAHHHLLRTGARDWNPIVGHRSPSRIVFFLFLSFVDR